jgi:hypothetical protein
LIQHPLIIVAADVHPYRIHPSKQHLPLQMNQWQTSPLFT